MPLTFVVATDQNGNFLRGDFNKFKTRRISTGHYHVQLLYPSQVAPIVEVTVDTNNQAAGYVATASLQNVSNESFDVYVSDLGSGDQEVDAGLNIAAIYSREVNS